MHFEKTLAHLGHYLCYVTMYAYTYNREMSPPRSTSSFCNHFFFKELRTVFIELKLIINNAPLTYVYPNNIKIY